MFIGCISLISTLTHSCEGDLNHYLQNTTHIITMVNRIWRCACVSGCCILTRGFDGLPCFWCGVCVVGELCEKAVDVCVANSVG